MSNANQAIEKFNPAALASIIGSENVADVNNDFGGGIGGDFLPTISLRGKEFRLKISGEETVVKERHLNVFLLASRPNLSKTFYGGSWTPGQEAKAPDCSSADGIYPDSSIEHPQNATCQLCEQNAWGSKITDAGKKGKACQDYKMVVLSLVAAIDTPFVLRIPPASLKAFRSYTDKLTMAGIPANAAVTRITFTDDEYPALQFEFTGDTVQSREQFDKLTEVATSLEVLNAIKIQPRAASPAQLPPPPSAQPVVAEVIEHVAEPEPSLTDLLKKDKAAKKAKPAEVVEAEIVTEAPPKAETDIDKLLRMMQAGKK